MKNHITFSNPKRRDFTNLKKNTFYNYYASYSHKFVEDVLNNLKLPIESNVMDPWNGSGTTTFIAEKLGYSTIGFDINPVMVIVAKAKRIGLVNNDHLIAQANKIVERAKIHSRPRLKETDLVTKWVKPHSAKIIRNLETAILEVICGAVPEHNSYIQKVRELSIEASFYYTALFNTFKEILRPFKSSNPTWIKFPATSRDRLKSNEDQVYILFESWVEKMISTIEANLIEKRFSGEEKVKIEIASSMSLPISSNSIDAVITSPPYCTRLDYAIATMPELALLGVEQNDVLEELRRSMIGTPTISGKNFIPQEFWGETCNLFLEQVSNHLSKASNSYYLKTYLQYFDSLYASMAEIDRTLKKGGYCVIVIQGSYYKNIYLDLPQILTEIGNSFGWQINQKSEFIGGRTFAGLNSKAQKYCNKKRIIESVLIFQN